MQIALAINVFSESEARELMRRATGVQPALLHVDVGDGILTPHANWHDPVAFRAFRDEYMPHTPFEVHLMSQSALGEIEAWRAADANRIIVPAALLNGLAAEDVMPSFSYTATEAEIEPYLSRYRAFHVLAVSPGLSGQVFNESALTVLSTLRRLAPDVILEVDGGMNVETARRAKDAGADIAVSSSYIWNASDPQAAYRILTEL